MGDIAATLLALGQQAFGQQVLQQQGGDQPTVCFALAPLLLPAMVIVAHRLTRGVRKLVVRPHRA